MMNYNFEYVKNEVGVCCLIMCKPDYEVIKILKENGFKYFKGNHSWSMLGFEEIERFTAYVIALITNDKKAMKENKPLASVVKTQAIALKRKGSESRKAWVQYQEGVRYEGLKESFNEGVATVMLNYCEKNKLSYYKLTDDEVKAILEKNEDLRKEADEIYLPF